MHAISQQVEARSPTASPRRPLRGWFELGEPHLPRGPFARWPRTADAVLAAIVFVGSLVTVAASARGDDFTIDSVRDRPLGAVAMLAIAATALLWRRQHPITVTAVVLAIMIGWSVANYGDGQDLAIIVAVYGVGRYASDNRFSLATVAIVTLVSILGTMIDANQRVDIAPALILAALPWYVGRRIRNRGDYLALLQERAERLEADQQARARRAVADERARIARELHDVVAHQVSMMTVQAGAAKTIAHEDIDAAVDAMADVEHAGRHALGELRHLLGVLRPVEADSDDLGPQPALSDIPALADELTHTGADVHLDVGRLPEDLSAALQLSAYRIVQESLTNIIKHAGPKPVVHLSICVEDLALVIEITNTVRETSVGGLPASGYGISGMSERADLLGGTFSAQRDGPDLFCVRARLPIEAGRA